MFNFVKSGNCRVEASYRVAYHLGVAGKPFFDGELAKKIILDVVKCVHPKQEGDYSAISLSRHTIQRRQQEIARYVLLTSEKSEAGIIFTFACCRRIYGYNRFSTITYFYS